LVQRDARFSRGIESPGVFFLIAAITASERQEQLIMAANSSIPSPELTLRTDKRADETIVYGSGRITVTTASLLQTTIRAAIPGTKRILMDLTNVTYIDSTGIGAMVSVYLAASKAQCDFKVVNAQPRVRDLFDITKLRAIFEDMHASD
jgi:anti-anti-sigma factor